MDIEIYSICCYSELDETLDFFEKVSTASSISAPYLTDETSHALLEAVSSTSPKFQPFASNTLPLPEIYTPSSDSEENKYHLYSYCGLTKSANIKGCYVVIGSESIQHLNPMQKYQLSRNILAQGRELMDIIQAPSKFIHNFKLTSTLKEKHLKTIEPSKTESQSIQLTSGCNMPGCMIS